MKASKEKKHRCEEKKNDMKNIERKKNIDVKKNLKIDDL
jgi:hypothetical protein